MKINGIKQHFLINKKSEQQVLLDKIKYIQLEVLIKIIIFYL